MEDIIKEQSDIIFKINTFNTNFKKSVKENRTRGYWSIRLKQLSGYWEVFENKHSEAMELYQEKEHKTFKYFKDDYYSGTDESVHATMGEIEDLMVICESGDSVRKEKVNSAEFKLPRLDLPTFNGDYEDWSSFHDLYVAAVHSKTDVPSVQKLQFLKSKLKGEPESLLRSFQITESNYDQAWQTLIDRYDNKRVLVNTQLRILFSQHKAVETAAGLRKVIDITTQCLTSLENLGVETKNWDAIIVFLVSQRLPVETLSLWEQSLKTTELPKFRELKKFLEQRFRTLECVALPLLKASTPFLPFNKGKSTQSCHLAQSGKSTDSSAHCKICNIDFHPVRNCPTLNGMTVQQRTDIVQQKKLCKNCFSYSHVTFRCTSPRRCTKCDKKHSTLLHVDNHNASSFGVDPSPATSSNLATQFSSTSQSFSPSSSTVHLNSHLSTRQAGSVEILLATALIDIASKSGQWFTFRALLDQGSQGTFMSENAAQRLGLQRHKTNISVSGVGTALTPAIKSFVNFEIKSRILPTSFFSVQAYVMPRLTNAHPSQSLQLDKSFLSGLQLADPTYGQPGSIDIILSAEIVANIIQEGIRRNSNTGPIAQQTKLGWILFGKVNTTNAASSNQIGSLHSSINSTETIDCLHTSLDSIDRTLKAFYEIEEVDNAGNTESPDDVKCERIFRETHSRRSDGRYTVALPFKNESYPLLGRSRDAAVARLLQIERRFERDHLFKQRYVESMNNFMEQGFLVPTNVTEAECVVQQPDRSQLYRCCYLPHHGVTKESSTTTKLRTVFDASCRTMNGSSLNDTMLTGPVLQETLSSLLLRWRKHPVAFNADITQMYLQIRVRDKDADYQRIVWRSSPTDRIQDYKLKTVTFGTASAPYLAVRTIHQLAQDEASKFPIGAKIIRNDFYVDDLMSGAETVEDAKIAQDQVIDILKAGGFQIRKWSSNSKEICENVNEQDREICGSIFSTVKTLGLEWDPVKDLFVIKTNRQFQEVTTKRTLLSAASSLFDPLGWVAPSIIIPKMILQKLWLAGLKWDEPLPKDVKSEWMRFQQSLKQLEQISLPRWIGTSSQTTATSQLHGFSDASEKAYGAGIYMRVPQPDGRFKVQLLTAKTRVAPLKKVTLPRLELCGALLLARLMAQVSKIMDIKDTHLWTDSQIVLAWIHGHPGKWKSFVANRVSEIQSTVSTAVWRYVPTKDNPADAASRGVFPADLPGCQLWWTGPNWLQKSTCYWPKQPTSNTEANIEIRKMRCLVVSKGNDIFDTMLEKYSSLSKVIRVTAYCLRWRRIIKNSTGRQKWLSSEELHLAKMKHIQNLQHKSFSSDIALLRNNKVAKPKGKLAELCPVYDKEGILRVEGRLHNSKLPHSEQHPIILPKGSRFSELAIQQAHRETLHGGPSLMLAQLRKTYWILDARNAIRSHVHKCVTCFRYRAQGMTQLMGTLPEPRVTISRPFTHTGVDYAGPLEILTRRGRGRREITKGYICLFVCLATKAIHLELVGDLTTKAFMSAFSRFAARRGKPSTMYSDNGTNFVGAARQLDAELVRIIENLTPEIASTMANKGIDWKFIPPAAPHFGGLWEAGVKSTKFHLKRILGSGRLTYEEMSTTLVEIEGCLNSRPLCPMTNDATDITSLTPAHFLIGESIIAPPRPSVLDTNINRLDHWQRVQLMTEHFWQQWSKEYLNRLQRRPKWASRKPNVEVNDLVIIKDERLPQSQWSLGRITDVHAGKDGLVRAATVKTATSHLKRPITKLCRLPSDDTGTNSTI